MNLFYHFLIVACLCVPATATGKASKQDPKTESMTMTIAPGETMSLPESFVRTQVTLEAVISFRDFKGVTVGLGRGKYCGGLLRITPRDYTYYEYHQFRKLENGSRVVDSVFVSNAVWNSIPGPGLTESSKPVKRKMTVRIVSNYDDADLYVNIPGYHYCGKVPKWWSGGAPFVTNNGDTPMTVTLSFTRQFVDKPVWFIGDSYFNTRHGRRWPYYMTRDGYYEWMADHIPGGHSGQMLACFKHDLDFGTPKIAVWMLGMNDQSDKDGEPNDHWLKCVKEFISVCEARGITPVLCTIPTVPKRFHDCKTEWVRSSGYRYIDWYAAVGTDSAGNWTEGYLFNDLVHPDFAGAEALWHAVHASLPELQ